MNKYNKAAYDKAAYNKAAYDKAAYIPYNKAAFWK